MHNTIFVEQLWNKIQYVMEWITFSIKYEEYEGLLFLFQ